ncbi:MAG: hypothetical protein QOJ80_3704 [Mycobacterium sp.]|jgi:hypothetical protein|nr:hypothetical protein [Mycobacterium sp.]
MRNAATFMPETYVSVEYLPVVDGSLRAGDSVAARVKIYLHVSRYHQVVAKFARFGASATARIGSGVGTNSAARK